MAKIRLRQGRIGGDWSLTVDGIEVPDVFHVEFTTHVGEVPTMTIHTHALPAEIEVDEADVTVVSQPVYVESTDLSDKSRGFR